MLYSEYDIRLENQLVEDVKSEIEHSDTHRELAHK
jgi:hypothetical protein